MNKKDILFPVIISILSVLFAFICLIVYLSNGKSKYWISQKIKIGAILLGMSIVVETGCITHTCYVPVQMDRFLLDDLKNDTILLNKELGLNIKGKINNHLSEIYSYQLLDSAYVNSILKDNLPTEDKQIPPDVRIFEISLPSEIKAGNYYLLLYNIDKENQQKTNYSYRYNIKIINR